MKRMILKSNYLLRLTSATKVLYKQYCSMASDLLEKKKKLTALFSKLNELDLDLGIKNRELLNPALNIEDVDLEVAIKKMQARSSLYLDFANHSIYYSHTPKNEQEIENSELTSHFLTCLLNSQAPSMAFLQKQQIMNVVFLPLSSFLDDPTTILCSELLQSEKDHLCFALVNYARSDVSEEVVSTTSKLGVFPCLVEINSQNKVSPQFYLLDKYINYSDFNDAIKIEASCVFVLYLLFLYFFFFADGYLIYIYSLSYYFLYSTLIVPELSNFQVDLSFIVFHLNMLSILNIYLTDFLARDLDNILLDFKKAFKIITHFSVLDLLSFGDGQGDNEYFLQSRLDELKKTLHE